MNPTKTIRISNGATNYTFTIYQQTEERLPDTDKLEVITTIVWTELRRRYHEVTFQVEYFYENHRRQWRLFFHIRNTRDSAQLIAVGVWIEHVEYLRNSVSHLSNFILADIRDKMRAFMERQRWKVTSRRTARMCNSYEIEITYQSQRHCFEARSVTMHNEYVDVTTTANFAGQTLANNWLEIEADILNDYCNFTNGYIHINDIEMFAFVLNYWEYNEIINFRIKPNIVPRSFSQENDIIYFESYPIPERARLEPRPVHTRLQDEREHNNRSARIRETMDYARRMGLITSQGNRPESAINDKVCKYFNGGAYLKCAVNPTGTCDGCKDYKPNE